MVDFTCLQCVMVTLSSY